MNKGTKSGVKCSVVAKGRNGRSVQPSQSGWKCSTVARVRNGSFSCSSQSKNSEDAYFRPSRGEPAQVSAASYNK